MIASAHQPSTRRDASSRGFRTVLIVVYGIFALSASARSLVQILRDFEAAPLAYSLSFTAALTYLIITVLMAMRKPPTGLLLGFIGVELLGVLAVGTVSITYPQLFEDATVWSAYGAGYGFVPLILPLIAGTSVLFSLFRARKLTS